MTPRDLVLRLRALVFSRRVERELDEELAFHIERAAQEHIARGMSAAEARREVRARFGPVPLAADECRDARGTSGVEQPLLAELLVMLVERFGDAVGVDGEQINILDAANLRGPQQTVTVGKDRWALRSRQMERRCSSPTLATAPCR